MMCDVSGIWNVSYTRTHQGMRYRTWTFTQCAPKLPEFAETTQPFGHNRHGPKIWGLRPLLGRGAGSPSNIKSPGPRPCSIPSDILIHAAIWPQQIWAENWGAVPLNLGEEELGPHLTQSPRLATIHACYRRQTDRQTTSHDNSRTLHCNGRLKSF